MANSNALEKTELKRPTSIVAKSVDNLIASERLHLPVNYSYQNALQEAELHFRQNPELAKCSQESIVTALMSMCVSGLSLGKGQGYFIGYGNVCNWQRSYFGDQALAERVQPGIHIYSDVIRAGEVFSVEKIRNKYGLVTAVKAHEQAFPRASSEIIGVYVGAVDDDGNELGIELMDKEQVHNSWKKSKQYNPQSKTFHNEQPDLAFKRTCIRRWSTRIIKTSDDEVLLSALRANDEQATVAEFDDVVETNQGKEVLSMGAGTVIQQAPTINEAQPSKIVEKAAQAKAAQQNNDEDVEVEVVRMANGGVGARVIQPTEASQVVDETTGEVHEQTSLMEVEETQVKGTARPGF